MKEYRIVVVGGGLVGLSTALALFDASPRASVTVLEKEIAVGRHQSSHNSGVLHAGLAYRAGSQKARLARRGIRTMVEYCQHHGIAHDVCGKLVLATDSSQMALLHATLEQGRANGLRGLRLLEPDQVREMEPHARCVAALHVPEEGIADFPSVCRALEGDVLAAGGRILTGEELRAITRRNGVWYLETGRGTMEADYLVNCAGLHADRVLEMTGVRSPARIVPFRGEYYRLRQDREGLVRNLIYPLPEPGFPFLGVHFTRRITGGIEAGPNAVLATAREGYRRSDVRLADLAESMTFPGLWRFAARHPRMVARELGQSLSKHRFLTSLRRLVPEVAADDLVEGGAGVRAQAMLPTGELVHDFLWVEGRGALHAINVPSPAATASISIGQEIAGRAAAALALVAPAG
ncbi:MAG: L-2-hydroxyglutarate oxidase [Gemmatimonadota bacterium]